MIAKDKASIISRALDSTKAVFDVYCLQDTGSSDNTVEVFTKWCEKHEKPYYVSAKHLGADYRYVEVDGKKILGEFNKARNDSFALIPKDVKWAFWIDTDDVMVGAEQIPQLIDFCNKNNIDQALLTYNYAKPIGGLSVTKQQRERLLNIKKKGAWKNWVHENYQYQENITILKPEDVAKLGLNIFIQHERTAVESFATNRRNNLIMKMQLQEVGMENFPDETLHHLAFDCWEHREYNESIFYYETLLARYQGKELPHEHLYHIYIKLSKAYSEIRNHEKSLLFAFGAIKIMPDVADAYLILAGAYVETGNWDEVEHYADKILKLGKPDTTAPVNEFDYYVQPRVLKLNAAINRNEIDKAIKISEELTQILANNPQAKQQYYDLLHEKQKQNTMRAIGELGLYYQENNQSESLDKLIKAIPLDLLDQDIIRTKIKELKHDQKRKSVKTRFPDGYKKTIIFYAGQGYEDWDGDSDTKKGIGGSEGMCIQLSRELAKLGNKVFVYNQCGNSHQKIFDGVTYLDYRTWDSKQKSDIFVSLRRPDVFNALIRSTKQYLWLHDTDYGKQSLTSMYAPNKVIVLSDYHMKVIMENHGITDKSIFWVSRNAVNANAVQYAAKKAKNRKPYQLIYASSYDRGLDHALQIMKRVKEEVPEAELKIFYGWNTFDSMMNMRAQVDIRQAQSMQMYKSQMIENIANTPGAYELGRVSQNELYKHFAESSIWLYPTEFTEISCITAMTAQAMGAVPVCTPVAALNETVNSRYGVKTDLDKIADSVIYLLKNQEELERRRNLMVPWAIEQFDIEQLAKEWDEFFNQD